MRKERSLREPSGTIASIMSYDTQTRRRIYDRTNGRCHLCGKKLSFVNYGRPGAKASWHVEHSVARARGGTDHLNNLLPACIVCNLDKGTTTSRTARGWYGRKRAPLSKDRRDQANNTSAVAGSLVGGLLGGLLGGPPLAALGAAIGGVAGYSRDPDKS